MCNVVTHYLTLSGTAIGIGAGDGNGAGVGELCFGTATGAVTCSFVVVVYSVAG